MSTITPRDMYTAVYKAGMLVTDDGRSIMPDSDSRPTIPRSLSGRVLDPDVNYGDRDKHFLHHGFYPFSICEDWGIPKLHGDDVPTIKLNFRVPRVTETNKIIYLPYFNKNITSTRIPINDTSVSYFITDALSGCSFFIDQLPGQGDLICYHANAIHSPANSATVMDEQFITARTQAYPTAVHRFSLRKDRYNAEALEIENNAKAVRDRTEVYFLSGTTVMGFRVDDRWEFWYQTYGRLTYNKKSKNPFKPNEVKRKTKALQIAEVVCFWREGQ